MANPTFNLKNQYGEVSENVVVFPDDGPGESYEGSDNFALLGPLFLNIASAAGSSDQANPVILSSIIGIAGGEDFSATANIMGGIVGGYSGTGTNANRWVSGGVVGLIEEGVTVADGAVVAHITGIEDQTIVNAAFKASMKSAIAGTGFTYGLDLTQAAVDGYDALRIINAAIRMDNNVCIFSGATAPVNGTTGDNFAGPGSMYLARDTGTLYLQTSLITTPTWQLVEAGDSALGQPLTGFVAGSGIVDATDTILTAFNKLVGNTGNVQTTANLLTGLTPAAGMLAAGDTILGGFNKLAGNVAAAQVDSVAGDVAALVVDFNALLAKLRAANLMAP